tara:strand:+ start:222 stop:1367 length:1146 start_codon:yes stop_codon:yes gene_type:complete
MKVKTILIITIFAFIYGQPEDCTNGRYLNENFDVSVNYGIEYGENVNQNLLGQDFTETLYMDIYSPSNDNFNNRPLIFFMFGGSFIGGSKSSPDIVALCNKYAQRGYVAVAIDYRLSPILIFNANEETAYKAVLKAMHDVKAAIRYFRMINESSPDTYGIDPNRIYVGGVSAGAIAAVNAGYLNHVEEVPSFLIDEYDSLGGLEGNSGNEGYDSSFHGIVNLCGAVGDVSWIQEDDIPIVSMHGDQDDVVPYDDNLVTLFGLNIQIDGSYVIHETMLELGNYSALHTYVNQGHTPFSSMVFETEFSSNFLYDVVCADDTDYINGDINFDYVINILDVVNLVNFILDVTEPSNTEFEIADMNGDTYLNVQDIIILINLILSN